MPCQEAEAVRILLQKHFAQISMTKTHLTGIRNGAGNTKCLKPLADCRSCLGRLAAVLLDSDSRAYGISPARVFKADGLNLLNLIVYVKTCVLCDLLRFFDRGDAIAVQHSRNFINTSFI